VYRNAIIGITIPEQRSRLRISPCVINSPPSTGKFTGRNCNGEIDCSGRLSQL
jgi:hypothetical protein